MGKRRCFLGFLVSLFVFAFSVNAFAAGPTCDKEYTSCAENYYLDSNKQCVQCPTAYPHSAGGSGGITSCYSDTKSRPWSGSQVNGETPTNCNSVTEWDTCSGEACDYVAYSNASGTGDGTIKSGCSTNNASCTKTPTAVTAKSGYYVSGTSCLSCSTKNSAYPNSDNGNTGGWTACYSNTKSRPWSGSQVNGTTPDNCNSVTSWNSCSGDACDYVAYLNTAGTGDGTIKSGCSTNNASCTKTPAAVTAKSGYYVSGTSCLSCSAKNSGYPNSANGNTGGWTVCYSNNKTRSWNGSTVACSNPDTAGCSGYTCTSSNCDTTSCTYTAYLNTAGNGEGSIKSGCETNNDTCYQDVASLTPKTGHHANGTSSCPANTFNVAYANGGGTGSAPTSPTSCTYGGTCNAPSNTYTRNGYDFTGWSCTASSGQCAKSSYAAGESISTATSVNGATITLTATWTENASNCEDGEYFNGTTCVSCGNGYDHSDGSRNSINSCYKSCTKSCSGNDTANCPANATCTYDTTVKTTGIERPNASCNATDPGLCPRTDFTCNACSKGTGAKTCSVTKGTNSCTYTGTCDTGYATPTASGSTVSCSTCADTYYYDNGICTSCGTVTCPDRSGTESCTCSCSVANGTCTCANGQQSYTDSCLYTNGAGGTNGASACSGESYTRKTTGQCTGTNTITCNKNYYLNSDACSKCPTAFPNTDTSGKTSVTACYTNCVVADVEGAATVSGLKYSNAAGTGVGEKTCSALTCDSNHCLANGENGLKICVEKPEHGQCTNNPDNPIQCNEGYHLDNGDCVADTYTVTYSCGTGTGTKPANQTATYDASFTPRNNTCTKTDYVFAGWTVSGTNDVKDAGVAFTWKYTEAKTFTAKWVNTVCNAGDYFDTETATCETCPDGYTSERGATGIGECYKTCQTFCMDPGVTPAHAEQNEYNPTGYWFDVGPAEGIQYYGSACETTEKCSYTDIQCQSGYYLNPNIWQSLGIGYIAAPTQETANTACIACPSQFPRSPAPSLATHGLAGPNVCNTGTKNINCTDLLSWPTLATSCSYVDYMDNSITRVNGSSYYPNGELKAFLATILDDDSNEVQIPIGCYMKSCTCEPGYEFVAPAELDATDPGACVPSTFTVTLNDNGGTGGSGTVYEKYSIGWYSDSAATTSITSVTKPTLDANHSFLGYFASPDADDTTPIIPASGALSNSTVLTANATLYAHWSEDAVNCVAGKTAANATCPAGSYCPGGSVPAPLKNDPVMGCARTCPSDVSGGTVTSPEGSTLITQCKTTRTGVALEDGTGAGNQTCYYDSTEAKYSNSCTIAITSCIAGRYREAEASITCAVVGGGAYSPTDDIERHMCSDLSGANETVTTDGDTSSAATSCYNICSNISIANGSRVTTNTKEFYDGTKIPACTYTTTCNNGYGASGETCTPNIYEITLNHDMAECTSSACTAPASPIFLKYATGWYASRENATSGTNAITSITMPNWPGKASSGYFSESDQQIIDATGKLTTTYTVFDNDATITASWETKPVVTCEPGTYYEGTGTTCTDCPAGSYCGGTTPIQDIGTVSGLESCPTEPATYTAAIDANGNALTVTITSAPKSKAISDCYASNVAYTATQGAGSQTCHYNATTAKYADNCASIQILTCTTGHWLENNSDTDCKDVSAGYYSPDIVVTRTECPNRNEDATITTSGTTSGAVTQCYRGNIWYEPTGGHSGHRRNCYHRPDATNTDISAYDYNCDVSVIVTCDAGYYDDGSYTNSNNERDCKQVGKGKYSPAQSACAGEELQPAMSNPGCSTQITSCPVGTGARDVTSTTPDTATTTSADITACYLTCVPTKNLNGTEVSVTNSPVHYNTTKNAYDTCVYDSDTCPEDMWCDPDGFHDCPTDKDGTAGKADLVPGQKYRGIETCYVLYNPFVATTNYPNHIWNYGTGWVKAFYEGTEANGDYTNYYNVGALTCDAGYYYDSSIMCSGVNTCQYSPAQSEFTGETPTITTPGSSIKQVACPAGCSGSEPYAYSYTQCYKACDLGVSDFAHSRTVVPESATVTGASATTYNECSYSLTCDTGYDAQNDGTPTPSCVAHKYTITLDKNGGDGTTPASVQCTFDSGSCALPAIVDTRDGYSTANTWCTAADGTGTCYDAGTTVATNISANASDTTLYAQWTPNVYTITLNHNGAATAGAPATVYLKYATGWYSDSAATTPITQLTTMPVKGVLTFAGYKGAETTVIASDGKFVTSVAALTFTTANATVTAQWTDAPITCPAGTFYAGEGDDPTDPNVCKTCTENHYCPGTTVQTNSEESGQIVCPDNGKAPAGSDSVSDCYKENLPTYEAEHGDGTQTCYYNKTTLSYSDRCKDFAIVTCDAGYWLDTTLVPLPIDCAPAGRGYYSADLELEHHACPNGGTTANGNTTAESVYECYKTDLDYIPTDNSGSGKQSCWYSSGTGDSAVYERECFDKVINKCRGGYYLANSTDIVCSEVGQNNYSVADDIERHPCPDGGKTNGKTTDDIGLCYKDGLEYRAQHGGGSQTCNWDDSADVQSYSIGCGDKKITYCDGGYYLGDAQALDCIVVGYNAYSPDRDIARYTCPSGTITLTETSASEDDCFSCPEDYVCNPDIGKKSCSELTNGMFTKSDAGTDDVAYCYAECDVVSPAAQMSGRNYNDAGTVPDTCEITQCEPGYYLQNGACVTCPAGSYCDGTNKEACPAPYTKSDAGTSDVAMCYKDCDVVSPATQMSGRDYNDAGGTPDTCQITRCEPGYYLQNGACVTCPAGSYCDGVNENECPSPYTKSDTGTADASYCYKDCDLAPNAQAMVGRDYNGAADTCEIVSCGEGYSLSNGQCVLCPAGSYCDGTPGDDGDGAKSCADLGDGSWKYSAPGSTKASDCYRLCTEHTNGNCLLVPLDGQDKAYWANKCQYTATVNGNPAEYDPETEMCTLTGCLAGFEMVEGVCKPCNRDNALSYKEGGNCLVESCTVGYHPKDDKCEADILDCTPQAPNATYAEQKWIATRGAYGICEIKSCEEDYHLASNACVANEQVCEVAHGVGTKTWNVNTNSWNPCEATSCVPGYTNDPYEKNDASEQCSECRNRYSVLGEAAATGYKTGCEIASCIYQGEKYNLENNECVPICSPALCSSFDVLPIQALTTGDYSDETGWMCWDDNTKKCRRTCNPGYMSW